MEKITLYYDGDCPFCTEYSKYVKLKQRYDIIILDARTELDKIRYFNSKGFNINNGMILEIENNNAIYQGDSAILEIDRLLEHTTFLDKLRTAVTHIPYLMRLAYPIIKWFRYLTLKAMGKNPNIRY